jgi:hypothetical protein
LISVEMNDGKILHLLEDIKFSVSRASNTTAIGDFGDIKARIPAGEEAKEA